MSANLSYYETTPTTYHLTIKVAVNTHLLTSPVSPRGGSRVDLVDPPDAMFASTRLANGENQNCLFVEDWLVRLVSCFNIWQWKLFMLNTSPTKATPNLHQNMITDLKYSTFYINNNNTY